MQGPAERWKLPRRRRDGRELGCGRPDRRHVHRYVRWRRTCHPVTASANRWLAVRESTAAGAGPLIIGHRGASALCPENSLEAFRRAAADGADGVEFDVLRCATGEPVVF